MRSLFFFLVFSLACSSAQAARPSKKSIQKPSSGSLLTAENLLFLGETPKDWEQYTKLAKRFRSALEKQNEKEKIKNLLPLANNGVFMEHANFALALEYIKKNEYAKSIPPLQKILYELPSSAYVDRAKPLLLEAQCKTAEALATHPKEYNKATQGLIKCLHSYPWKEWGNHESEVEALYTILQTSHDPLFRPFVAELLQALPANATIRSKIAREVSDGKSLSTIARLRSNATTLAGVKAVNPDADLFDQGMTAVISKKYVEAKSSFQKLITDFPQSEHLDRAQYWRGRTEEFLGNKEEARSACQQIMQNSPLSYYGLQCALRWNRDLKEFLKPGELKAEPLQGMLLTRQALSIWKLRALLDAGLLEQARMEAEFLFQHRPGGSTFGQDNANGALLVAQLFRSAGYHLAVFSHTYAALSLDPTQLNLQTLEMIFPKVFWKEFQDASEITNIHPLLLLSLSKQESAFLPNAISRSDAFGLMQLILPTAREMNPKVIRDELFNPVSNIELGSKYLQKLLERFQGNVAIALAGYNAGPHRAQQWMKKLAEIGIEKDQFDVEIFIDTIPFTETRKYVGSILRNYAWYKLLLNDGALTTVQELSTQWQKQAQNPNPPQKTKDTSAPTDAL